MGIINSLDISCVCSNLDSLMSILEIAKSANVSKSTVSRVINNDPRVSGKASRAVKEAMARAGYRPSPNRPGPKPGSRRRKASDPIALIRLGDGNASSIDEVMRALHAVSDEVGQRLIGTMMPNADQLPDIVAAGGVRGVLIRGHESLGPKALAALRNLPVVWLMADPQIVPDGHDHVTHDDDAIGRMAARYLIERGHEHVACLNPGRTHPSFPTRELSFVTTIVRAGSVAHAIRTESGEDIDPASPERFEVLVDKLLAIKPRVTGVFVVNDCYMVRYHNLLLARGIKPGTDLQLISCDNDPAMLELVHPRPATIDRSLDVMAQRALAHLDWLAKHGRSVQTTIQVGPRLVLPDGAN